MVDTSAGTMAGCPFTATFKKPMHIIRHDKLTKAEPSIGATDDVTGMLEAAGEFEAFRKAGVARDREKMEAALTRSGFTAMEAEQATDEVLAWVEHLEINELARYASKAFSGPVRLFERPQS